MDGYISQFIALVDSTKLTVLFALILGNFVTGIAVAIKTGVFNLKQMGEFLYTRVLPYVVAYLGVGLVAMIDEAWKWSVTAVWCIILATLIGAILENLRELGVPIPSVLGGGDEEL